MLPSFLSFFNLLFVFLFFLYFSSSFLVLLFPSFRLSFSVLSSFFSGSVSSLLFTTPFFRDLGKEVRIWKRSVFLFLLGVPCRKLGKKSRFNHFQLCFLWQLRIQFAGNLYLLVHPCWWDSSVTCPRSSCLSTIVFHTDSIGFWSSLSPSLSPSVSDQFGWNSTTDSACLSVVSFAIST